MDGWDAEEGGRAGRQGRVTFVVLRVEGFIACQLAGS